MGGLGVLGGAGFGGFWGSGFGGFWGFLGVWGFRGSGFRGLGVLDLEVLDLGVLDLGVLDLGVWGLGSRGFRGFLQRSDLKSSRRFLRLRGKEKGTLMSSRAQLGRTPCSRTYPAPSTLKP